MPDDWRAVQPAGRPHAMATPLPAGSSWVGPKLWGLLQTCTRKKQLTKRAARAHASELNRRPGRVGAPVHAYKCPHCTGWHVGKARQPLAEQAMAAGQASE